MAKKYRKFKKKNQLKPYSLWLLLGYLYGKEIFTDTFLKKDHYPVAKDSANFKLFYAPKNAIDSLIKNGYLQINNSNNKKFSLTGKGFGVCEDRLKSLGCKIINPQKENRSLAMAYGIDD